LEDQLSRQNNVNPDHYKEAGREPTGKGPIHGNERQEFERTRAETPHIPNQERASPPSPSGLEEEPDAADDTTVPNLSDDEGMPD
jgi:hypothetical protein